MEISTNKKIILAVIGTAAFSLSIWFSLSQAAGQADVSQQPAVEIKFQNGLIRAKHALDFEVEWAKNSTALVSLDQRVVKHIPKMTRLLDAADTRWQAFSVWCEQFSCHENTLRVMEEFESVTVSPEQALVVITSIPKFTYVEQKITEDGSTLLRYHQATIEYNGKYYILTIHTDWKL